LLIEPEIDKTSIDDDEKDRPSINITTLQNEDSEDSDHEDMMSRYANMMK
jgi:hypothetical protein